MIPNKSSWYVLMITHHGKAILIISVKGFLPAPLPFFLETFVNTVSYSLRGWFICAKSIRILPMVLLTKVVVRNLNFLEYLFFKKEQS